MQNDGEEVTNKHVEMVQQICEKDQKRKCEFSFSTEQEAMRVNISLSA